MNKTIKEEDIIQTIKQIRELLQKAKKEYRSLPEGSLNIRTERGHINYCHSIDGVRRGITKNEPLVHQLARKKYLETYINTLEENLAALNKLIKSYHDIDPIMIVDKLKKPLQDLPIEIYVPYIRKKHKWMNESFEQSTLLPEEKDQVTARGLWVRSKSEVIIAEKLDIFDVPYRYEQIIRINGRKYAPDFTVLTKTGIIYWEHCGKVNDPKYMKRHRWRLAVYESAGIVPWKNLIVTYDDERGGIDSRIIESEIVNKLL